MILILLFSVLMNIGMTMKVHAAQASNAELARLKQARKTKKKQKTVWVKKQIKPEEKEKKEAASYIHGGPAILYDAPGGPDISYKNINTCQQVTSALIETNLKQSEQKSVSSALPIKKIATELDLEMIDAVRGDNLNKVQALLKAGANKDAQDSYGWTALFWAIVNDNARIANALINAHADINIQDSKGWTTLMDAVARGKAGMVQILISAGANVNVTSDEGITPLMWAATKGNLDLAKILMKAGALLDVQELDGYTALMFAITGGREDIAKLLISAGADLNVVNASGWTALMHAANNGNKNILIVLLNANANPYIESFSAKTICEHWRRRHIDEKVIAKDIAKFGGKTFYSLLRALHPNLLKDADIQKALAANKYVEHFEEEEKKEVAFNAPGGPNIAYDSTLF